MSSPIIVLGWTFSIVLASVFKFVLLSFCSCVIAGGLNAVLRGKIFSVLPLAVAVWFAVHVYTNATEWMCEKAAKTNVDLERKVWLSKMVDELGLAHPGFATLYSRMNMKRQELEKTIAELQRDARQMFTPSEKARLEKSIEQTQKDLDVCMEGIRAVEDVAAQNAIIDYMVKRGIPVDEGFFEMKVRELSNRYMK